MPRPLNQQVIVITGASSGIGREAALRFGRAGASLVLAARNAEALHTVAEEIRQSGGQAHVVITDVSDHFQVNRLAQEAVSHFGRIDTWVNDASVSTFGKVEDTALDEIQQIMQVNLMGTIYGTRAAIAHMKGQGGTIINIGSIASERSIPLLTVYSASKHGVKGFTEGMRLELIHDHPEIKLTLILPASIDTPFFTHARANMEVQPRPMPPVYRPEEVARSIVYAAQHPQRDIYVGGASWFFSVMQRISPRLLDQFLLMTAFRMQKTDQPPDNIDNLYYPARETGSVHGEYTREARPSLYTRFFELIPTWQRILVSGFIASVIAIITTQRR